MLPGVAITRIADAIVIRIRLLHARDRVAVGLARIALVDVRIAAARHLRAGDGVS